MNKFSTGVPITNRRLFFYFFLLLFLVWATHLILMGVKQTSLPQFFTYMCLACTFIPLPTIPPILYISREFNPLLVAVLGAIGTCLANLNDYYLITYFSHWQWVKKFRKNRLWSLMVWLFNLQPFLTLSLAAFVPIPIDFVRFLAITNKYNRFLYSLAYFAGRFPRYFMIAYLGYYYQPSNRMILYFLLVLVFMGIVKYVVTRYKKNSNRNSPKETKESLEPVI